MQASRQPARPLALADGGSTRQRAVPGLAPGQPIAATGPGCVWPTGATTDPDAADPTVPTRDALRACCYLDHERELSLGLRLGQAGGPDAAWGWLHAALVQVRMAPLAEAAGALERPRQAFSAVGDATGLAWCDEALAILRRREGDFAASAALHASIDARTGIDREPLYRFVALNSRAITNKLQGDHDLALRQHYAAQESAFEWGHPGPQISALSNLGGHHADLFNLEDARSLIEQALQQALAAGMSLGVAMSALNLVRVYYSAGEPDKARAMVAFALDDRAPRVSAVAQHHPIPLALGHLAGGEIDTALGFLQRHDPLDFNGGDGLCEWSWIKARCLLALGDAAGARAIGEQFLARRRQTEISDRPYDSMQLLDALAEACGQLGDHKAGFDWQREAHARYVQLVGRSARARHIALEVGHQLASARRERDHAVQSRQTAEEDRRRLSDLNAALQAKVAETERLHQELKEQALRDPLTGLHNRRHLFEAGPALLQLAQRRHEALCVAIIDLDHFKRLNDTFGHAAGDHLLKYFAELLRQHLRACDIVCRYGGEEFVAVMPGAGCTQARGVLQRLQDELQRQPQPPGHDQALRSSFSAGVAQFPDHGQTLEQLLARADQALYRAKHLGRARAEQAAAPAPDAG